jgi:hypothetical protein
MIRKALVVAVGGVLFSLSAHAAVVSTKYPKPKLKPAPSLEEVRRSLTPTDEIVENTEDPAPDRKPAEAKAKRTGSEAMMSQAMRNFRTRLLSARDGDTVAALLLEFSNCPQNEKGTTADICNDTAFRRLPADLQYVVARLQPLVPFRGFLWRMAPLAHKAVISQTMMISLVRSFAETLMIYEHDTHWKAYMAFLAMPHQTVLARGEGGRKNRAFETDNDVIEFLRDEVYPVILNSIRRLDRLEEAVGARRNPLVFDNQLRFGQKAFSQRFEDVDRFALIGKAEIYASMARFYRRLSVIAQLSAYNWAGNQDLRKDLGKKMGWDEIIAAHRTDPLSVEGLTRKERVDKARWYAQNHGTFALRDAKWMKEHAYDNFRQWARYSALAWNEIKDEIDNRPEYDFLLDPELFAGRKKQIQLAMDNLKAIAESTADKPAKLQGAVSGETIWVNFKGLFDNPPANLTDLMPIDYAKHADDLPLDELKELYRRQNRALVVNENKSVIYVTPLGKEREAGKQGSPDFYEWRNYLWGRAIKWNKDQYAKIFVPDPSDPGKFRGAVWTPQDVDDRLRVLAETRGGRVVLNTLAVFVK